VAVDIQKIRALPRFPGVYLMKDAQGRVLYVGKAKDLRARVLSYFRRRGDTRHAVGFLLQHLHEVEVVVTSTEKEALVLENSFIKRHRPRYNVAFRDDKSYFHLRIDKDHPFPRVSLVRQPRRDGALYFGPYTSSRSVRQTLRLLQRQMGLRSCKESQFRSGRRSCLNYQMGRCAGVCLGRVSPEQYAVRVKDAILLLQGRSKELIESLERRMKEASGALRFEEAARIRDQIRAVERTVEGQRVVTPLGKDHDVVGLHREGERVTAVVLKVREGKVLESITLAGSSPLLEDREIVSAFLKQFYGSGREIPSEVLVPVPLQGEGQVLEQWLGEMAGHRVRIRCPRRGRAKELAEMARQNAELAVAAGSEVPEGLEAEMARRLQLRKPPRVLEGFDVSTMGGEGSLGVAVRFADGNPDKRGYRSYNIRTVHGMDDYAMMYELLLRHLRHRQDEGELPDLVVLDGGKGQLGVARAVLEELGLRQLDVVALAKARGGMSREARQDRVFITGRKEALRLARESRVLRLLQRVRDEAHRFAVGRHRKGRFRRRTFSVLDTIPGVGPERKKALLKALGSLQGIKEAPLEALAAVPGLPHRVARAVFETFHPSTEEDTGG
jgi:excinuclease ABC subunit C